MTKSNSATKSGMALIPESLHSGERVKLRQSSRTVPPREDLLEWREVITVVGGEFGLEQRDACLAEGIGAGSVPPQRRTFDIGAVAAERRGQLVYSIAGLTECIQFLE